MPLGKKVASEGVIKLQREFSRVFCHYVGNIGGRFHVVAKYLNFVEAHL